MAKKNKKQAHKKKRAEARKRQKAKVRAQPKLFRKDPNLKEALDHRHHLVTCLINEEWQEYKFANVYVIRDSPFGLVLVSFLIDLAEVGLKDAWVALFELELARALWAGEFSVDSSAVGEACWWRMVSTLVGSTLVGSTLASLAPRNESWRCRVFTKPSPWSLARRDSRRDS